MSLQVSRIKGIGYKLKYEDNIFSHINDKDSEGDFLDVIGMSYCYYDNKKEKDQSDEPKLKIINDGMSGEYIYILYLEETSFIENTHGDDYWCNKFRYDDWVKKYAREHITTLVGRDLGELKEFDFKHFQ